MATTNRAVVVIIMIVIIIIIISILRTFRVKTDCHQHKLTLESERDYKHHHTGGNPSLWGGGGRGS